jgi:hypothetical protein
MMDLESAYYQGMSDYQASLASGYGYGDESAYYDPMGMAESEYARYGEGTSPEELAYYQGMADYEAAISGSYSEGGSPEEEAYYQGMADYATAISGFSSAAEEQAYYQGTQDAEQSLAYAS